MLVIANFAAPSNDTMASILIMILSLFYQLEHITIINTLSFFFREPQLASCSSAWLARVPIFSSLLAGAWLVPIVHRRCMGYVIAYASGGPPAESLVRMVSARQRILNSQTQTAKLYVAVNGARQPMEILTLPFSGGICNC